MVTDHEHIHQSTTKRSSRTVFKNFGIETWERELVEILTHALEVNDEGFSPNPVLEGAVTHPSLTSPELCATIRGMEREETERSYVNRMLASVLQVTEEAFPEIFQMGFESLRSCLKAICYIFTERALTEMSLKKALDDLFDQIIKNWTQPSVFMDVPICQALILSRFVHPKSKYTRGKLKEQFEVADQARDLLDFSLVLSQVKSSFNKFSENNTYCKDKK